MSMVVTLVVMVIEFGVVITLNCEKTQTNKVNNKKRNISVRNNPPIPFFQLNLETNFLIGV
jgi:hypothetical protein